MRLIDADNLYFDYIVTSTTTNTLCHRYISKEQVENAPTVDAIPIEWIKDYVDFGVSDELAQRYRRFVLNMIKDWEKENELWITYKNVHRQSNK